MIVVDVVVIANSMAVSDIKGDGITLILPPRQSSMSRTTAPFARESRVIVWNRPMGV